MLPKYTPNVGQKFNEDLSIKRFPGNTIICFVDPDLHPTIFNEAVWAQHRLQAMSCAGKFHFLPPSSFHMTVIELLCDQVREKGYWSKFLPLDMPLEETDRFFIEKFSQIDAPSSFAMTFKQAHHPATLQLEPANGQSAAAIAAFREQMAELLGVRRPNFEGYSFHITLGYNLIELEPAEVDEQSAVFKEISARLGETFGVFETAQPTLTFFDDMGKFVPAAERLLLHSRSK